jgi:sugar lactone lactonase YvrE
MGVGMEPVVIADYGCVTGEGPLWHEAEGRLYWVDIPRARLFRYEPATGRHEEVYRGAAGEAIGGFTIQSDGALLLFGERGTVRVWREGVLATVIEEIEAERETRFNDVIADPVGRVWCGTMPAGERPGRLYRLDPDGTLTVVLEDAGVSNGMGFTPDLRGMYHTDSAKGRITLYDYDRTNGAIANGRVIVAVPGEAGVPDGMAVDAEGDVWSARWDGGALFRYGPDGTERGRVAFPARQVSSVAFGGPGYEDAYVTTAGGDDRARHGTGAGALFRVRLGVRGRAPFLSRIGL